MESKLLELLKSVFGSYKHTSKSNYAFSCPHCHTPKKKFEIDIRTQHSHCWICNASNKKLITLFKTLKIDRQKQSVLIDILKDVSIPRDSRKDVYSSSMKALELPKEFKPLWVKSSSFEYKNALWYVTKRGITLSEIVKYGIGYCEDGEYAQKIIIPSYDSFGSLNYFVGRSYFDSSYKHKNPTCSKNIIGFEMLINWDLPVVLVEGAFDAIAVKRNSIPLFGKTISDKLKEKIINESVRDLYICLDKDAQTQALKHAEYFMNLGINVYFVNLYDKDPSEIGFVNMCKLIKDTKQLTFSKFVEMKLLKV